MRIPDEAIMSQVNNLAFDVIKKLFRDKFRDVPIMFTGASDSTYGLPDVACVLSISVTDELCDKIADAYSEALLDRYSEEGEDMDVSAPNYDGILVISEKDFDGAYQTGCSFYVINGEFYRDEVDVLSQLRSGVALVSTLLDIDVIVKCSDDREAYQVLRDLRKKIGYSVTGYVDVRRFS